jgi:hypothetical protein
MLPVGTVFARRDSRFSEVLSGQRNDPQAKLHDPNSTSQKKDRPVAPTRPNGFVNHVAMVAKKILILRADWSPGWTDFSIPRPD